MGHQRIAGLVCEVNIAGRGFLRVDVPDANGVIQFSRIYAPDAIYCISPTDRQIAIGLAVKCAARPFQCYDLQRWTRLKQILASNPLLRPMTTMTTAKSFNPE